MEYEKLKQIFNFKGYPFYENGFVNVFGFRTKSEVTNKFDDMIGWAAMVDGQPQIQVYPGTTVAGLFYVQNPMIPNAGVFILAEGFQADAWALGRHHDRYPALVQVGTIKGYRDNNRDNHYDFDPTKLEAGNWEGVNIHHAQDGFVAGDQIENLNVDNWSAGCQVVEVEADHIALMDRVRADVAAGRNLFSYALFNVGDLQLVTG